MLTTHYMDEAQRLCDRVAIMSGGNVIGEGSPAALIETHLAPEAVELDCDAAEESALLNGSPRPRCHLRSGRRLMLFVDDAAPLVEQVRTLDHGDHRALVVRPANLEDVFLCLTGTSL